MLNGWICLDKPSGISSNFAMLKVRRLLKEKTGYIGTLDPFATGVLPIAVGKARKFIQFAEEKEKRYDFIASFGCATDTIDLTGKVVAETEVIPTEDQIRNCLQNFIGEIEQVPPLFSAIKINGRRACDLVRQNKEVTIPSRKVQIFDLKFNWMKGNLAAFSVCCSKGTYVRTLAADIAEFLGSLCHVSELRRTCSGFFSLKSAITLEKLSEIVDTAELGNALIPLESPLDDIPALHLGIDHCTKLQNGLTVSLSDLQVRSTNVRLFDDEQHKFKGVCHVSANGEITAVKMCIN